MYKNQQKKSFVRHKSQTSNATIIMDKVLTFLQKKLDIKLDLKIIILVNNPKLLFQF